MWHVFGNGLGVFGYIHIVFQCDGGQFFVDFIPLTKYKHTITNICHFYQFVLQNSPMIACQLRNTFTSIGFAFYNCPFVLGGIHNFFFLGCYRGPWVLILTDIIAPKWSIETLPMCSLRPYHAWLSSRGTIDIDFICLLQIPFCIWWYPL